jgi:hypothetical protein
MDDQRLAAGLPVYLPAFGALTTLPLTQACDQLLGTLAPRPADDIAILMART